MVWCDIICIPQLYCTNHPNQFYYIYNDISILWYLTLLSPPILSQLLLSFLTLSYHAHLRVDLGRFGVRFEVHFGVHFDPPGDLPEGPKNGLKKHPKPGGPKHCKTAAGIPKTGIRGQGRKALAYDASSKFVHITMKRDAFCPIPSQNKRETYQRMHLLNLICCEVVLLTLWVTHATSTDAVHTLPSQILLAHIRMSRSYAVFARGFHVFPPFHYSHSLFPPTMFVKMFKD